MDAVEDEWRRWLDGRDEDVPLDEALHRVAREEGAKEPLSVVTDELDRLADIVAADPDRRPLEALVHTLFVAEGFRGDEEAYDDPQNSRIDRVLVRRRGLPILLSAVTLEVGRRVGLELVGVGFPGHFLVSTTRSPRVFVDPFHGGQLLRPAELAKRLPTGSDPDALGLALAPTSTRDLLVRVSTNLIRAWLRRGEPLRALANADRRLALRPDVAEWRRERGLLRAMAGLGEEAAVDLSLYLDENPEAPDAAALRWRITSLLGARAEA